MSIRDYGVVMYMCKAFRARPEIHGNYMAVRYPFVIRGYDAVRFLGVWNGPLPVAVNVNTLPIG